MKQSELNRRQNQGASVKLHPAPPPEPPKPDPVLIALEKLTEAMNSLNPQAVTVENNLDLERLVEQQSVFMRGMMDTLKQIVRTKQPTTDQSRIEDIVYEFIYSDERDQRTGMHRLTGAKSHVVWSDE